MEELLYTVKEVSGLLKVNPNFIYTLIENGELKALKIGSLKIRHKAVIEYLDNLENNSKEERQ